MTSNHNTKSKRKIKFLSAQWIAAYIGVLTLVIGWFALSELYIARWDLDEECLKNSYIVYDLHEKKQREELLGDLDEIKNRKYPNREITKNPKTSISLKQKKELEILYAQLIILDSVLRYPNKTREITEEVYATYMSELNNYPNQK